MKKFFDNYNEENFAGCLSIYSLHIQEFEELKGEERLRIFTKIAICRQHLRDFVGSVEICRSITGLTEFVESAEIRDEFFCVYFQSLLYQRDSKGRNIEEYFTEASKMVERISSERSKEKSIFIMKIMKEQSRGVFNLGDLLFGIERPNFILVSDYVNPGIRVENFESKGRGYCAVRNFGPGDLLIVEKCIFKGGPCLSPDESLLKLLQDMKYGLRFLPTLKHRLNELSDGKRTFKERDAIGSEILRGIIETNAFVELHRPNMAKFFLDFKAFPNQNVEHEFVCILFERISMLNHSCNPNCNTVFLGDVGVVVAGRQISKGEEICFDYYSGRDEKWNMKRKETISSHFGVDYQCDCRICENGKTEFQKWQKVAKRLEENADPSTLLEYYISLRSRSGVDWFHPNCIDIILLFASHLFFPLRKHQKQQQRKEELGKNEDPSKLSEWRMDFFDQICRMIGSHHGHGLVFSFFQTLHFLVDMKEFRKCLKERKEVFWNTVFCKIFGKSKSSRDVYDSWLKIE